MKVATTARRRTSLYRLSPSEFADKFILKGAALLLMWLGEPIRPTKDVDLLGFGDTSTDALRRVFVALCAIETADDGLTFVANSVSIDPIREDQAYGGMRVKLMARSGTCGFRFRSTSASVTPWYRRRSFCSALGSNGVTCAHIQI